MDKRPFLNKEISPKDFCEFYWLKTELVAFCRTEGLKTTGSKGEISERIEQYLETGQKHHEPKNRKINTTSDFDWNNESLSLDTQLTDNYKNTENVRKFFRKTIGSNFKFNVKFMNWMKANAGKTLQDAIVEWKRIKAAKKDSSKPEAILPQFEYNKYLRDFLADNPTAKRDLGIKSWKIKKSLRGDNSYSREDLHWLKEK